MQNRIAISGKICSGKSTLADYLVRYHGYQVRSFASPFKWIIEHWFRKWQSEYSPSHQYGFESPQPTGELFEYLIHICDDDMIEAEKVLDYIILQILPRFHDIKWDREKDDQWREFLQAMGNEIRSNIRDDIWASYLMRQLDPDVKYVCDDLRYYNELHHSMSNGFMPIRINISKEKQQERVLRKYGVIDLAKLNHVSETQLDSCHFDYVIDGDLPREEAIAELKKMIGE
jgi:hypothetical protein